MNTIRSDEKTEECSFAEKIQKHTYELEEDKLRFFKGCKNAFLLTLPLWIAIFIIWIW
ncbi:hypothetical protein ABES36_14250 [Bacillus pseudomycoides]|uniref:hypothetical protein n=1 Tax=Bacillus pseudomycoides TaxID=64104 RepID=UPI0015CF7BA1|nr:hypothetical protein [Bacillus pseudomycoides]